jgi:transposase
MCCKRGKLKIWQGKFLRKDGDHEWHMIDASIIRAHRHAAGAKGGQDKQGLGRSCGGFSSKIHAKVDSFGMPLEFIITAGQLSDIGQAEALVGSDLCEYLLADRGYDSDPFRQSLEGKEIIPVIPGRKNRVEKIEYDEYTYKERNAVERFFGRLKEYRRIATRYDKTAIMFKAGLVIASILMWINL